MASADAAIARVDLHLVALRLLTPFVTAHGTEDVRNVVVVKVTRADGGVGWGECPALSLPTYTSEYTEGAWTILVEHLAPALVAGVASGVVGHPMARSALAYAVLDASARAADTSAAAVLHKVDGGQGELRSVVPTTRVLGLAATADDAVAGVAGVLAAGGRSVKLKITPDTIDHLTAVRSNWPGRIDLELAVDANGSLAQAPASFFERLDSLDLAYLEQPFGPEELVLTGRLANHLITPIALDESLTSLAAAQSAFELGALQVANVKPARLGGPVVAAQLVALANELDVPAFVGGMLESGVGRAGALAVAALPGCTLPTDLGPSSQYFESDLTPPIKAPGPGQLQVPAGPGIGVAPDPARLEATTVRHQSIPG